MKVLDSSSLHGKSFAGGMDILKDDDRFRSFFMAENIDRLMMDLLDESAFEMDQGFGKGLYLSNEMMFWNNVYNHRPPSDVARIYQKLIIEFEGRFAPLSEISVIDARDQELDGVFTFKDTGSFVILFSPETIVNLTPVKEM